MNKLIDFALTIFAGFLFGTMILLTIMALITPEKTKNGTYTDFFEFWTNDTYIEQNF